MIREAREKLKKKKIIIVVVANACFLFSFDLICTLKF